MTKLFDALVAYNAGQVAADIQPALLSVEDSVDNSYHPISTLPIYEVLVKIGARVVQDRHVGAEDTKRRAWASISHHVYGEFREDIENIRRAIYMRDLAKAEVALAALHNKMFML